MVSVCAAEQQICACVVAPKDDDQFPPLCCFFLKWSEISVADRLLRSISSVLYCLYSLLSNSASPTDWVCNQRLQLVRHRAAHPEAPGSSGCAHSYVSFWSVSRSVHHLVLMILVNAKRGSKARHRCHSPAKKTGFSPFAVSIQYFWQHPGTQRLSILGDNDRWVWFSMPVRICWNQVLVFCWQHGLTCIYHICGGTWLEFQINESDSESSKSENIKKHYNVFYITKQVIACFLNVMKIGVLGQA